MDIDELKKEFTNFVSKYDMKNERIARKYNHSFRVMNKCLLIAKYLKLNQHDIDLSCVIGLLHDYARFEQATIEKYDDRVYDHGNEAVRMLFDEKEIEKYWTNIEDYSVIRDAIMYHNKRHIDSNISDKSKLFCKIIRDADKLDGFENKILKSDDSDVTPKIDEAFRNKKLAKKSDRLSINDKVVFHIAMVFDINFKCSFIYLKENKLIEKIFNKLNNKEKFKLYFDIIFKYVEERIDD